VVSFLAISIIWSKGEIGFGGVVGMGSVFNSISYFLSFNF
jgi:hypothetical protein